MWKVLHARLYFSQYLTCSYTKYPVHVICSSHAKIELIKNSVWKSLFVYSTYYNLQKWFLFWEICIFLYSPINNFQYDHCSHLVIYLSKMTKSYQISFTRIMFHVSIKRLGRQSTYSSQKRRTKLKTPWHIRCLLKYYIQNV